MREEALEAPDAVARLLATDGATHDALGYALRDQPPRARLTLALVEPGFPVLVFAPRGSAQAGLVALADELRIRGSQVLLASPDGPLPLAPTDDTDLDPIAAIAPFYAMAEALAQDARLPNAG